jgi:hypothetical protein
VYKNRVLKRIFGPKRVEVRGSWRKLHNEELRNLHSSSNIIRMKDEMNRACSTYGEKRNAYKVLMGKIERKRLLGRPKCR